MCLDAPVELTCCTNSDASVATSEQELWETILTQHDLSVDRGSSPSWITYGWRYREADTPFAYDGGSKSARKRTVPSLERDSLAKHLEDLVRAGMGQNEAARSLGIPHWKASRALKAYNERKKVSVAPIPTQVEGNE